MAQGKSSYPTYNTLTNMRGMTPQMQNLYDLQWKLKPKAFNDFDLSSSLNNQQDLVQGISDTQSFIDNVWFFTQQLTLPTITIESGEVQMPIFNPHFQNKITLGNFSVTFNDPYGIPITRFFEQWMYKQMQNPEQQGINLQTDYKSDIIINIYSGIENNSTIPMISYVIYGQYPSTIPQQNLDYANTEQRTVEMTFSYDYQEFRIGEKYIGEY